MSLKVGALFSGYGGIEIALASVLPTELSWYAEVEAAPSKIMAHHHPGIPNHGDVTKIDWRSVEPVDIITGGSPCQDLSHAGKRAGMKAGTRSGLWASMCDAIDIIRPRLVVWENVRGALSAEADSAMEQCPGCVGDGDDGPVLRALGRVLGDLADLGYDAWWYGLRAADVGAAHGRFRVFLFATPADADLSGLEGLGDQAGAAQAGRHGHAEPGTGRPDLTLLPTPAVNDMGKSYTPQEWDAWTERMKAEHGNGNGHGKSLNIEALRLLPTPRVTQPGYANDGRGGKSLDVEARLLPTPTTSEGNGSGGHGTGALDLRTTVAHLLPTPQAHDAQGGKTPEQVASMRAKGYGVRNLNETAANEQDWREYEPAIRRQEAAFGRPAPAPTEPGKNGKPRLSPLFVEWLMGLPEGHVTDVPDVSRNDQLKALGNGVVPQQCAAAFRAFLADTAKEHAA